VALDQPQAAREQGRAALNLEPDNREARELMEQISKSAPAAGKKP
jgi:hypothetical protein